jgi:hypothetical protein
MLALVGWVVSQAENLEKVYGWFWGCEQPKPASDPSPLKTAEAAESDQTVVANVSGTSNVVVGGQGNQVLSNVSAPGDAVLGDKVLGDKHEHIHVPEPHLKVELSFRRALLQLQDAIADLRYPLIRPDEINSNSDESNKPFPPFPDPDPQQEEEWTAFRKKHKMILLENRLTRERQLFELRWSRVMKKYRDFQKYLLEAHVHGFVQERSSKELDDFLSKVFMLFQLRFEQSFNEVHAEHGFPQVETGTQGIDASHLPSKGWSTKKTDHKSPDLFEADLSDIVNRLLSRLDQ